MNSPLRDLVEIARPADDLWEADGEQEADLIVGGKSRNWAMGSRWRVAAAALVVAGACGSGGVLGDRMKLDIANGTSIAVSLVVNEVAVGQIAPGQSGEFKAAQLPRLPWNVEARTISGRPLVSLHVNEGDVMMSNDGSQGDAARVDLSCGRIDIWSGPPLAGPMPGPGTPGDCDP